VAGIIASEAAGGLFGSAALPLTANAGTDSASAASGGGDEASGGRGPARPRKSFGMLHFMQAAAAAAGGPLGSGGRPTSLRLQPAASPRHHQALAAAVLPSEPLPLTTPASAAQEHAALVAAAASGSRGPRPPVLDEW